jgi:hypothetical protein
VIAVPLCSLLDIAHPFHKSLWTDAMVTSSALDVGGELWQHIGDHYSEAYAAKIMRDVLRTIAQVCCLCCITSHVATSRCDARVPFVDPQQQGA